MNDAGMERLVLGQVAGIYGVRGSLRIHSYTRPRENIFTYRNWWLGRDGDWRHYECIRGQQHNKGLIATLAGVDDRDQARTLLGLDIAVDRAELPPLPAGEYYWCDLLGLRALSPEGREFGRVVRLEQTGANDVLVVRGPAGQEWLIPYVSEVVVVQVDLPGGTIVLDWSLEE